MSEKDGGPAFPRPISHDAVTGDVKLHRGDRVEYADEQDGMTLRDYFAGKALQGLCANTLAWESCRIGELTVQALGYADAMLEARKQ